MKPRLAARVDSTQAGIVAALRFAGAKVEVLDVGRAGVPDLLVGWLGTLTLIECKSRGGKLRPEQEYEREAWGRVGIRVAVCVTPKQAMDAVGMTGPAVEERRAAMRSLVPPRALLRPSVMEPTEPPRRTLHVQCTVCGGRVRVGNWDAHAILCASLTRPSVKEPG